MAKRKDSQIRGGAARGVRAAARRAEGIRRAGLFRLDHRPRSGARQCDRPSRRNQPRPLRRNRTLTGACRPTRRSPPRSFSPPRSAPSPALPRPRACCAIRRRRTTDRGRRKPRPAGQRGAARQRTGDAQGRDRQRSAQHRHAIRQAHRAARPHREGAGRTRRPSSPRSRKASTASNSASSRRPRQLPLRLALSRPKSPARWRRRKSPGRRSPKAGGSAISTTAAPWSRAATACCSRSAPGSNVPGLGRVETIKRENGKVVVVTASGIIARRSSRGGRTTYRW